MALNLSFFFLDKMIAWRMRWENEFPYCSPMQSHSKTHACRGNDGLRNGYGFPDSFRTRITERKQKEGIFISQFENTFIIYRTNLQYVSRFSSYNSIIKRSYCKVRQSSCSVKFKLGNLLINLNFKPLF